MTPKPQPPKPRPPGPSVPRPQAPKKRPGGQASGASRPSGSSVAGPLGRIVGLRREGLSPAAGPESNALVMLRRITICKIEGSGQLTLDDDGEKALLGWACGTKLGQSSKLVADVYHRREAALRALGSTGQRHLQLRAEPEWQLITGLGNKANAHEIGMALHGTYGWPVIPGSGLKGMAAAWAVYSGADEDDVRRVFGGPRPGERATKERPATRGSVRFLDALPDGKPVSVMTDVMTPHVKPYYDQLVKGTDLVPPAEYHNPVPLKFLTVRGGYAFDLYGPSETDLKLAAGWLAEAGDELGAGAKTAAGYGYLSVTRKAPETHS